MPAGHGKGNLNAPLDSGQAEITDPTAQGRERRHQASQHEHTESGKQRCGHGQAKKGVHR